MDTLLLFSGFLFLLITFFIGFLVVYFGYYIFQKMTKTIDEKSEILSDNRAVAILLSSFIFSFGYLLKNSIRPIISTLFNLLYKQNYNLEQIGTTIGYIMLQFVLSLVLVLFSLYGGMTLFHRINKNSDEMAEIKKNNISVAILSAAIIITLAMIFGESLDYFLEILIPHPQINNELFQPFG